MASVTKVALHVGDTYALPLKSRGSAGYSWTYELSGDANAVEVSIRGAGEAPPRKSGPPPASYSADEEILVRGLVAGEATIHLSLRRPWEKDKAPLAEQVLVVNVKPGKARKTGRQERH